jgi:hypothetical protein
MSLRESIASDAVSVFLSSDEFAETVVYLPRGGGSRTILAIVDREPPTLMDDAGNVMALSFMLYVANSGSDGITAQEIDTGGDRVKIGAKVNDLVQKTCTILRVMDNDHGMLQLAIK